MDDTCQMRRCFEPATHSVHLRFWAKGYPRDTPDQAVEYFDFYAWLGKEPPAKRPL